jgi:hypothetical protein
VILLHLNDEGPSADWGRQALIQDAVNSTFGSLLFTPRDKQTLFPSRWPSLRELRTLGRRVIVYGDRVNNDDIFPGLTQPGWDLDTMKYFSDYPQCAGYGPGDWAVYGGESQVVGPIYNGAWPQSCCLFGSSFIFAGTFVLFCFFVCTAFIVCRLSHFGINIDYYVTGPAEEGLVVRENFPALMACGITCPSLDIASPALLQVHILFIVILVRVVFVISLLPCSPVVVFLPYALVV